MIDYLSMVNYINERKIICNLIKYANKLITALIFISYPVFIVVARYLNAKNFWLYILVPAVSFVSVSVFRYLFNAPRPYEKYSYKPIGRDNPKSGKSFPSRHVFSSFIISFMIYDFCPVIGLVFIVLSAILAILRVLSGTHFIKDVVAGILISVALYILLMLLK